MKVEISFKRKKKNGFNEYSLNNYQNILLIEWIVNDNDFIKKGDPIAHFSYLGNISKLFAPEDGFIEIIKIPDLLYPIKNENEKLFIIYLNQEIRNERIINNWFKKEINDGYSNYFLRHCESSSFSNFVVSEGDFVTIGQIICDELGKTKVKKKIPSPEKGIIELFIFSDTSYFFESNKPVFSIYQNGFKRLQNRYINKLQFTKDNFTNRTILSWDFIGQPSEEREKDFNHYTQKHLIPKDEIQWVRLSRDYNFSVENINGKDYLLFIYTKNHKLDKETAIYFLFENSHILKINLQTKPFLIKKNKYGIRVPLYKEEIEKFLKLKIDKIRISKNMENINVDIEYSDLWYKRKEDFQFVIQQLFNDYVVGVNKYVENYSPISQDSKNDEGTNTDNEICYVYLMTDTTNNYHKIGISNSPSYREKTLQSEKPTIELLCSKKFPSRTIAQSIEKALHNSFKNKRLRGEWFELTEKDVEEIKATLK